MFGCRESKVCHRPGKAVEKGELRVRMCARGAGAGRRDQRYTRRREGGQALGGKAQWPDYPPSWVRTDPGTAAQVAC